MKSRYSVWPSAYASGALVKCRKKGAANWGNSSKKEEVFMDDLLQHEYVLSENRFAAYDGKDTDAGAKYAKPFKGGNKKGVYTMKGKDGKPLFPERGSMKEGTVTPGADLAQRKLNKDENNSKLKVTKKIMEQEQRMAMYSRALGVMGAQYSGFAPVKKEEEAVVEASKPDYLDFDKDGDKEEPMKKALKEKGKKAHDKAHDEMDKEEKSEKKEDVELTKEMVVEYLVNEGYATNEVSAEILHTHMSDEFLEEIEERLISEMGPAYPSETKAQAKAQSDHREGKSSAGLKTAKNPGLKASHSSGANKQD